MYLVENKNISMLKVLNVKKYLYSIIVFFVVTIPQIVSATIDLPTEAQTGLPEGGNGAVLKAIESVVEFVVGVIGSIAVLMIVISGIMYMVSGGDQQKVETAKKILTYSIVGLVVALVSYMIVYFISRSLGAA
jgi:type IV secretory pathway VirB2 component (pilin)